MLQYIKASVWRTLFGKSADALEKVVDNDDEYHLIDNDPLVNHYISVPPNLSNLNCAAFVAGVVRGVLAAGGFPAAVSAHTDGDESSTRTIFLVKFSPEVIERERALGAG